MKKLFSLLAVALVTILTCSVAVSAAAENDIITALNSAGVPAAYVATAESYIARTDVNLTDTQINGILADINDAKAIKGSETHYSKLTADQKEKIAADVIDAAKLLGLTTSYGSNKELTISDASGKTLTVVNMNGAVKHTGFDYTIVFVGLAVIALAGVSAVVVNKALRKDRKLAEEC